MLRVVRKENYLKSVSKIKDGLVKRRIKKLIRKIIFYPEIGKPMVYSKFGTREVYLGSYRLSYIYIKEDELIVLLDFYHKGEQ